MTVRNFLDISTAHLTMKDAAILEGMENQSGKPVIAIANREYGWFIHVPDGEDLDDWLPPIQEAGFSEAFVQCIKHAQDLNCDYILFDRDATTSDKLETFDW